MKAKALTDAIIAELKTITEFGSRVYAVPSQLVVPPSQKTPMALVVYRGSDVTYQKGANTNIYIHRFAVYIVHGIWREELVITDSADGLLVLLEKAIAALKDKRFPTVDQSIIPDAKNILGTEDYLQWGWYGASIGFEINYTEVES